MKPVVIIVISVVCSVAAIGIIELIIYEDDIGGSITNIVPFDCAKAWDDRRESLRIIDPDAYKKLGPEEKRKVKQDDTKIDDEYHANWCATNHEEWQHRAKDLDGRLAYIDSGRYDDEVSWNSAIASEKYYNEKFPDGAWQFQ